MTSAMMNDGRVDSVHTGGQVMAVLIDDWSVSFLSLIHHFIYP